MSRGHFVSLNLTNVFLEKETEIAERKIETERERWKTAQCTFDEERSQASGSCLWFASSLIPKTKLFRLDVRPKTISFRFCPHSQRQNWTAASCVPCRIYAAVDLLNVRMKVARGQVGETG